MKSKSKNIPQTAEIEGRHCKQCSKTATVSPLKLERILVPVDFSDCSKKALQYAIPFASQSRAEMIFLHVLTVNYTAGLEFEVDGYDPLIEGDLQKDLEKRLAALIRETVPRNISTKIEMRHGSPAIEIVNAAKELDVSLIVMSTHGHTGRVHAFIGSVAGDVTRLAPCPVLMVREHEHEFVLNESIPFKTGQSLSQFTGVPCHEH
jgi:universal stress protein A